jgi:uncharacterized protein
VARDAPAIDAYGDGGFRLDGVRHEGSLLIVGDAACAWSVATPEELTPDSLQPVLAGSPGETEMLLLGMGTKNALPPRSVRDAVRLAGLGLEFLDTPAAARLYNLLTSEGRRVAAALIAI